MSATGASPADRGLLIESLWRDTRREGEEIEAHAREEAERIRAESGERVEKARQEARVRAARETAPEAARIRNHSRHRAGGEILLRQQALVASLFEEAGREVLAGRLPEPQVAAALAPLLAEVLEGVPAGAQGKVTVRPADRARCRALLAEREFGFAVEVDPALTGGVVLEVGDPCETRDNSLRARLEALRSSPPLPLFPLLFPDAGEPAGGTGKKGI